MTKNDHERILDQLALQAGGLIEIYVLGTSYDDWFRVLEAVRSAGYVVSVAELVTEAPVAFGPYVFASASDVEYRLTIQLGSQLWTSNFFSDDVIDLQGDPRDVSTASDLAEIMRLMTCLNEATDKRVILIPEAAEPRAVEPYLSVP